jgi:hypothetical protein
MGVVVGEDVTVGICIVEVGSRVGKVCTEVAVPAQPATHELIHSKLNVRSNILFILKTYKDICSSPLDDPALTYAEFWQLYIEESLSITI